MRVILTLYTGPASKAVRSVALAREKNPAAALRNCQARARHARNPREAHQSHLRAIAVAPANPPAPEAQSATISGLPANAEPLDKGCRPGQ